jgi:hypothetical protein
MRAVWYARATRFCSYAVAGVVILLCALSTAYSLRLVFRSYHAVLFWDQWGTVELFDRLLGGSATLSDFIADHNEHRLLVPRLIFALDLWLTDARNGVNFAAILICQAIHVALFHHMISQRVDARAVRWALTAFVTLLLFCIVQKENFTWGFQIQSVGVFLLFTLAAWTLATAQARSAEDAPRRGLAIAGLLCGLAAAFTMANGVVALFAIAVVFAAARLLNRLTQDTPRPSRPTPATPRSASRCRTRSSSSSSWRSISAVFLRRSERPSRSSPARSGLRLRLPPASLSPRARSDRIASISP